MAEHGVALDLCSITCGHLRFCHPSRGNYGNMGDCIDWKSGIQSILLVLSSMNPNFCHSLHALFYLFFLSVRKKLSLKQRGKPQQAHANNYSAQLIKVFFIFFFNRTFVFGKDSLVLQDQFTSEKRGIRFNSRKK